MKNIRRKYEKEIRAILNEVALHQMLPTNFNCDALEMCLEKKYIIGLQAKRAIAGNLIVEVQKPTITKAGLDFLSPPSDYKFIITTILSVAINIIQFLFF